MYWNNQAENMTKAWMDSQKKMWQDWYEFVNAVPTQPPFDAGMVNQWSKMAAQGFEAWAGNAEPTAKATAQRVLDSQQAILRFLEFSAQIWQDIAAKMQSGENWQEALGQYTDQLKQHYTQTLAALSQINQDSNQLWQLYTQQMQLFTQPLLQYWKTTPQMFTQAANGSGPNFAAFSKTSQLYWDLYEQTFGDFLTSPAVGYTREMEEKMRQGFAVWQNSRKAELEYYTIVAEAWVKAFEQFNQKLVSLAQSGQVITSLEELSAVWVDVAETAFGEVFQSEKYIVAQGNYLNANMAMRIQQKQIVEMVCKQLDIPTRTEVDQAHKASYELRKEVKALKKALAKAQQVEPVKPDTSAIDQASAAIKALQKEVAELKKTVAQVKATKATPKPAAAKPAPRKTTTSRKKASPAKTGETPEGGN